MRTVQFAFAGGEFSPAMFARADDQKYKMGLAKCENFICLPQGAVRNRPGFAFVRAAKYTGSKVRLLPFKYSSTDTMVLEFGNKYIRFHTRGATLLNSSGAPYEISTPYDSDDIWGIKYAQSADVMTLVHESFPVKELRRYSATDWRLADVDFNPPISPPASVSGFYTEGDNATGYDSKIRYNIKYVVTALYQDADGTLHESRASNPITISSNLYNDNATNTVTWSTVANAYAYRVYKTYSGVYGYIGQTEELSFLDNNKEADESVSPPRYDELFTAVGAITSVSVINGGSGYSKTGCIKTVNLSKPITYENHVLGVGSSSAYPAYPVVTAKVVDSEALGSGAAVSVQVEHSQDSTEYGGDADSTYDLYSRTTVTAVTVTAGGENYGKPYIQFYHDGAADTKTTEYCTLTLGSDPADLIVTDSTGTGARLTPVVTDGRITSVKVVSGGTGYTNPTITAVDLNGSGASFRATLATGGDYPGAVAYYEQRRFLAATPNRPLMIWGTQPGTESSMAYTLPAQDDNRIKFRMVAQQASKIQHLVPISQFLVLTESGEFRLKAQDGGALTAETVSVAQQANIGTNEITPLVINNVCVYVAKRGGHLREIGYSYQAGGFVTSDLAVRCPHLFETNRINDMDLMQAPEQIIWASTDEGELYGVTYLPEQQICAWHRHTTDGFIESVCCVSEDNEDRLYIAVRRVINGATVRYIEQMGTFRYEGGKNAFFVDSGITYSGSAVTSLSGLSHLEGKTVAILADGAVMRSQKVVNGKITLEHSASTVQIGLPITADLQTLPLVAQLQDGSYGIGHSVNVNKVWLGVYDTKGVFVGPAPNKLTEIKPRTDEAPGAPPKAKTGRIAVMATPAWLDSGQVYIRQSDPLPVNITGLCVEVAQ